MTALGIAILLPTCAHCGFRNAARVIDGEQACFTCFPDVPDDSGEMPPTGAVAVMDAMAELGDATIAELAETLEGDARGTNEERAQFHRVQRTVQRMVAAGVIIATGERRRSTGVYRLTGKPFVDRRGRRK